MTSGLKDRAWKLIEIAFCVALAWLVLSDWKSFLAWSLGSAVELVIAVLSLLVLAIAFVAIKKPENDSENFLRNFLFRSMLIGFALCIPCAFFAPTRKVVRFLMGLQAIQVASDLVRLSIVCAIIGLVIQGLLHLTGRLIRSK